jgi:hypothetical protein
MADGLDVVAVGVAHEGAMVIRASKSLTVTPVWSIISLALLG